MIPDHYKILGISRNASKQEIKKAYKKLALKWHPDKNESPHAHHKFIEINKAYLILSDDEAREKYNKEYDYHFGSEQEQSIPGIEFKEGAESEEWRYKDEDLNNWSRAAEKQGEEYASMKFDDFSNMVKKIVKEVGIQSATAFVYAISGIVGASSIFSFFSGIYYGDMPQILFAVFLFGLAVIGINLTTKKYS